VRVLRGQTRAKAIRKYVDKMIQLAKVGTLHARRQARSLALPFASVLGHTCCAPALAHMRTAAL